MKKPIPKEKKNPLYDWMPTNSCLGIIIRANSDTRDRAINLLESNSIFWIRIRDDKVDAVIKGGEEDYLLNIDFEDNSFGDFVAGSMRCECESFIYREGPCKHVTALALEAIVRRSGGEATYRDWISSVCSESRNSGAQYMPWENRPVISEEIAEEHGVSVKQIHKFRKKIDCYELDDGMYWTGDLPLPSEGETVKTKLATGEETTATIVSRFEEDENNMLGFWAKLDNKPEVYKSDEIVLYGSEIRRKNERH